MIVCGLCPKAMCIMTIILGKWKLLPAWFAVSEWRTLASGSICSCSISLSISATTARLQLDVQDRIMLDLYRTPKEDPNAHHQRMLKWDLPNENMIATKPTLGICIIVQVGHRYGITEINKGGKKVCHYFDAIWWKNYIHSFFFFCMCISRSV